MTTKLELWGRGRELALAFCRHNGLAAPRINDAIGLRMRGRASCGWYCNGVMAVEAQLCANLGYGGRAWSWPGYVIDRTPYGVFAHELGHYVDHQVGGWRLGPRLRKATGEPKLTNYCPNAAEWFAEMFRLFCTNPGLLKLLRPGVYQGLIDIGLRPLPLPPWTEVLRDAPQRTRSMAARRVGEAIAARALAAAQKTAAR